jgi:hypothetical protein
VKARAAPAERWGTVTKSAAPQQPVRRARPYSNPTIFSTTPVVPFGPPPPRLST